MPDIDKWNQDRNDSKWDATIQQGSSQANSLGFTGHPVDRGPGTQRPEGAGRQHDPDPPADPGGDPAGQLGLPWGGMASNQGDSRRLLVITADDYGYWPSYNQGILEAIEMGAIDSRQRDGRARVLRGRAAARERGGDRPAHRVRGALGAAQRRAGPDLAAGPARAVRRHLRPLAGLPERASALPRAAGAGHAGLPDGASRSTSPVRSVNPDHRQWLRERGIDDARPPDRPHREQAARRAPGAEAPLPGGDRVGHASRAPGHRTRGRATTWRARRTWRCSRRCMVRARFDEPVWGDARQILHEGGVRPGARGREAGGRPAATSRSSTPRARRGRCWLR